MSTERKVEEHEGSTSTVYLVNLHAREKYRKRELFRESNRDIAQRRAREVAEFLGVEHIVLDSSPS